MPDNHRHKWRCFKGTLLICDCDTVTEISDLLASNEAKARIESKVEVLAKQLFGGELKKEFHRQYYAWVIQNNPDMIKPTNIQESLL